MELCTRPEASFLMLGFLQKCSATSCLVEFFTIEKNIFPKSLGFLTRLQVLVLLRVCTFGISRKTCVFELRLLTAGEAYGTVLGIDGKHGQVEGTPGLEHHSSRGENASICLEKRDLALGQLG